VGTWQGQHLKRLEADAQMTGKRRTDKDSADAKGLGVRMTPTFYLESPAGNVYRIPSIHDAEDVMEELR
jgi:hypothetical protein